MSLILKKESSLCLSCMNQMKIRLNDRLHDDFVLFYVLVPIHMFSWWCWHLSLHFLSNAINQSARTFTQSQGAKCCCIHCCLEVLRGKQIKFIHNFFDHKLKNMVQGMTVYQKNFLLNAINQLYTLLLRGPEGPV